MVTSYTIHYTATDLSINRWGKYLLSKTDDNMISLYDGKYSPIVAGEIWLYGNERNGNILAHVYDNDDGIYKYELLTPKTTLAKKLRDISREVYDGKYRITHDTNDKEEKETVSIIRETDGASIVDAYKWENVTDINNGLAIIEIKKGIFALYNLKDKFDLIGSNYDIDEIVNVIGNLYKYKKKGILGYYLYNSQTKRNSLIERHSIPYKDIKPISEYMVMLTFYDDDEVCFVSVNADRFSDYIGVAKSQLNIDTDKKIIKFKGWYGDDYNESDITIDFNGNRLEKKNNSIISTDEVIANYNRQHSQTDSSLRLNPEKTLGASDEIDDGIISIVRCWVYFGVTTFITEKLVSFNNSFYTKKIKEGCLVAWVLPTINKFIVGVKGSDDFLWKRVTIKYQSNLEEGLLIVANSVSLKKDENYLKLAHGWQGKLSEIQGMICDSLSLQLEKQKMKKSTYNNTSTIGKKVVITDKLEGSKPNQRTNTNEQESLLLKEVYLYLQGKGFNKENILNSISILFPGFEHRLLDANNDVRVNNPQLFKDIDKYTEFRDNRDNLDFIKSKLKLNDEQKEQLQYRLVVKGNTFSEALQSVDSTGVASRTYSEIMDSNEKLKKLWRQVGQLIIDEIVAYQMEPTKEYSQELEQDLTKSRIKSDGKVSIPLKDEELACSLDDIVSYSVFQRWKKVTYSTAALKYVKIGHNIFLFLDKKLADKIDQEGNYIISDIPGEGKPGEQTFGQNINSDLDKQKEKGIRILVFARKDDTSCRFCDEFEVLKVEENTSAREIKCTFKSMYRFQ